MDDVVIVATGPQLATHTRYSGEIIDYTGVAITLRRVGGREDTIPSERVIEARYTRGEKHLEANALRNEGDFQAAATKYREALRAESRTFVQREILASIMACQQAQNQIDLAGESFLALLRSDPQTLYFPSIPLTWLTSEPRADLVPRLESWRTAESPTAKLLGASWLLSTAKRAAASETLRGLAQSTDVRIAGLAEAQLWRIQLVTATEADVTRWHQVTEKLPPTLRGGPHFLVGKLLARLGRSEEAALSFMRVPILHAHDRALAAESLLATGAELERIDRREEALLAYREAQAKYASTTAGQLAVQRIQQLETPAKP